MKQSMHSRISETNRVRSYHTRQSRGLRHTALSSSAIIDKFAILPILAFCFAAIVFPLLGFLNPPSPEAILKGTDARLEPRIFWPSMAMISVLFILQHRSRLTLPPNIKCLIAYLAFAGASILWAFNPETSFIRYLQQLMVVTSIVLPGMLAARTVDMMRALFLCFALALILNLFFVLAGSVTLANTGSHLVNIGYRGYFESKNQLGECAAAAFLLSLHEMLQRGWRRALGAGVVVIAIVLVYMSDSKTAFGLALICPFLAGLTLFMRKAARISPAIFLLIIPFCYLLLSSVTSYSIMGRISSILFHDWSLTGRTFIWDFAQQAIGRSPLIGWGYQSFWLVPDSPSHTAPGWVKMMPNAHNGYYDTTLEMGYIGLAFLLIFILATIHAAGRVADRDPRRAQLLLSLSLFIVLYNFFESLWMRGFEFLWVLFVIVAVEIGRHWRPFSVKSSSYRSKNQKSGSTGFSSIARIPPLHIGQS